MYIDGIFTCLLYYPSIFGGLNLSHFYSHMVRGYDDPLPLWISSIKFLYLNKKEVFQFITKLIDLNPLPNRNQGKLVEDMFPLNIESLPSIEKDLRDSICEYLKSDLIENPEIKLLYDSFISVDDIALKESIVSIKPYYPSLGYELFKLSNPGIFKQQQNRFKNIDYKQNSSTKHRNNFFR